MTPINAHLLHPPDPVHLDQLRERLESSIRITTGDDVPADTHILIAGRPSRDHLEGCPDLQALIIPWTGLPEATRELLADFPHIAVHNLHHNAPMTAEMAVALLMAAAKTLIPIHQAFRENDWTPRYRGEGSAVILDGKCALILGYGVIGQRVGAMCRALGMSVLGVRRNPDNQPDVYPLESLHDLLPRAHVLMVCLPGTPETEDLIAEKELALLPKDALLVNIGRGPIVNEDALHHALKTRQLYAAGLDVWYNYPTDPDSRHNTAPSKHPFGGLENVVMSPHRAGAGGTHEAETRRMATLARYLNAAARGEPMPHRVDVAAGY
jgi:phosphoglycerate dehydrogenase-like enzyme